MHRSSEGGMSLVRQVETVYYSNRFQSTKYNFYPHCIG